MESGTLRRRILDFLAEQARPLPAGEILAAVLGIRSPNEAAADRVLRAIVGTDRRLRREGGRWTCRFGPGAAAGTRWEAIAALHIEAPRTGRPPGIVRGALHLSMSGQVKDLLFGEIPGPPDTHRLKEAARGSRACPLLLWDTRALRLWNRLLLVHRLAPHRGEPLLLAPLAHRIFERPVRTPEDLAGLAGLRSPDADDPAAVARFYAEAFAVLLERVPEEHRADAGSLTSWIEAGGRRVDFRRLAFGPELLSAMPAGPGVYIMRNRAGDVIYVGKAANLRRRVRSYFAPSALADPKIAKIHEQLHDLEFAPAPSEAQALVMEMRLIRDFRPRFNLQAEVHENPEPYGRPRNLIILVREQGNGNAAAVYFVRDSVFAGREPVVPGSGPGRRLCRQIRSLYFSATDFGAGRAEPWERELVGRWLKSNLKRFTAVDVDEAGDYRSVIRHLRACLRDPEAFERKVYYR